MLILPQIIMADQTLSGVPPVITLSGLQGTGGFSGQQQQTLSGQGGQGGGGLPGMTGGLDLMQLLAMLGQGGTPGAGTDLGLTSPLGAGAFSQPGGGGFGGISGGGLGLGSPQGGQGTVAGQTGQQSGNVGQGSIDPLSVIQKALGLAQKGAGLLGTDTASPTIGDTGGTSLSDQNRSATGGTGGFTASPTLVQPYGQIDPSTGLPMPGTQQQPVAGPGGVPASGFGEIPGGSAGGTDPVNLQFLNQSAGGQVTIPPSLAAMGVTRFRWLRHDRARLPDGRRDPSQGRYVPVWIDLEARP